MTCPGVQLIREAMNHLAVIQEIAEKPYMIDKVVDIPTIREKADEALRCLLAADVILSDFQRGH